MKMPDHFSESLETVIWVKNTKNSLMLIRIRDLDSVTYPGAEMEKFGSGINIPDPQQWLQDKLINASSPMCKKNLNAPSTYG
jgi:hypothetical protein